MPAYLHSLSPATHVYPEFDWLGEVYQPACFGDGQDHWAPDFIGLFGALAVHDLRTGNKPARLEAIRWLQIHTPPGGQDDLWTFADDS